MPPQHIQMQPNAMYPQGSGYNPLSSQPMHPQHMSAFQQHPNGACLCYMIEWLLAELQFQFLYIIKMQSLVRSRHIKLLLFLDTLFIENPHFIPPQHIQYNPNSPQRHGPGPGAPMFYQQHQVPTPQQTPQSEQLCNVNLSASNFMLMLDIIIVHHNILSPPLQNPFPTGMQGPTSGQGVFEPGLQH